MTTAKQCSILEILISTGHDYWVPSRGPTMQHGITSVTMAECVEGHGIRGDRYFLRRNNHKGQITFMSWESIEEIRREFGLADLPASVFRRNVIVQGLDLSTLIDEQFELQGVVFEGSQECKPCQWMDHAVAVGAREFMKHNFRGGLRCRIKQGGLLRVNTPSKRWGSMSTRLDSEATQPQMDTTRPMP